MSSCSSAVQRFTATGFVETLLHPAGFENGSGLLSEASSCPVCDDTGLLLGDTCPLCGERGQKQRSCCSSIASEETEAETEDGEGTDDDSDEASDCGTDDGELCQVCGGTGELLLDPCPLCDGRNSLFTEFGELLPAAELDDDPRVAAHVPLRVQAASNLEPGPSAFLLGVLSAVQSQRA